MRRWGVPAFLAAGIATGAVAGLVVAALSGGGSVSNPVATAPGPNSTLPPTATPSDPPVTTTATRWLEPGEAVLGPAVLLPRGFQVQDGFAVFSFHTATISPHGGQASFQIMTSPGAFTDVFPGEIAGVAPTSWTLVTDDGDEIPYLPVNPLAGTARFAVPEGFTVARVRELRLDAYRVGVPVQIPIAIPVGDDTPHAVAPGITVRVAVLLEQGTGWLVVVELEGDGAAILDDLTVEGVGVEWGRATGSLLGTPRWTMEFTGETLPDPIPLEARGLYWVAVERPIPIDLSGVGQ